MHAIIDQDLLAAAVAQVARILPARPVHPVLSGIRLAVADGTVEVSAYDYEASVAIGITADTAKEGTVLIPGRMLREITRELPGKRVDLAADGSRLTLSCGNAVYTLALLPEAEYPALPGLPPLAGTIGSDRLAVAVAQVAVAASRDDTLPMLTCILAAADGAQLTLAATDRYRLAVRRLAWQPADGAGIKGAFLLPAQVLGEVAHAAAAAAETAIHLAAGAAGPHDAPIAGFTAGPYQATVRLLSGEFPSYESRFPSDFTMTAEVPAAEFAAAAARVAVVAAPKTPVRITFARGQARLEAGTGDDATATEEADARLEGDGGEFAIAFNPGYLIDGLKAAGAVSDTVRIAMTSPVKPAVITAAGGDPDGFRYLLVPVRSSG